jgi:hypothetical protein
MSLFVASEKGVFDGEGLEYNLEVNADIKHEIEALKSL